MTNPNSIFKSVTRHQFSNIMKTLEKGRARALMIDYFGLDYAFQKMPITKGLKTEYAFMTDSGGGASGGLNYLNGRFAKADVENFVKGSYDFKASTFTMEWQKHPQQFFGGERDSYENPKELQMKTKVQHHKNLMGIMNATDGTGRVASPASIEGGKSGPNIIKPYTSSVEYLPLNVEISTGVAGVFGSVAYLYDSMVVSFMGVSYDEDNNGAAELVDSTSVPRYLMIGFREQNTADAYTFWDAFRVIEPDMYTKTVALYPARRSSLGATAINDYDRETDFNELKWCSHTGNAANGLEIVPAWGVSVDPTAVDFAAHAAVINAGWGGYFDPATTYANANLTGKPYFFPTQFPVPDYDKMRECLGLSWTISTDIGKINPYWSTGIRALLENRENTVHGIQRPRVLPYLPTHVDGAGANISLSLFMRLINKHKTRNRNMKDQNGRDLAQNVIPVNTLAYSYLLDEAQANRMFTDKASITFGEGEGDGIEIKQGGKKYKLTDAPEFPEDFIAIMPQRIMKSMGGEIKDVSSGGVSEFLKIQPDISERINVAQKYKVVTHENICEVPRSCSFINNFKTPTV